MQPAEPLRDFNLNNRDTEQHRRTDHDRFDCDPFQAAYPTVAAPIIGGIASEMRRTEQPTRRPKLQTGPSVACRANLELARA